MRKLRYCLPAITTLLICLAVAGCGHGGGGVPGTSDSQPASAGGGAQGAPEQGGAGGAKGAPAGNGHDGGNGDGDGSQARGAPIKIPPIVHTQGFLVPDARQLLIDGEPSEGTEGLAAECGGQLCVTLESRPGTAADGADGFTQCQFLGATYPAMGTVVYAGDTIWMLTGDQPCTSASGDDGSPSDGQSPNENGSPPDEAGSPAADTGPSPADSTSP